MTDRTKQTEADRLANQLDYHREYDLGVTHTGIDEQAAAELRRQQAEIERLNEALAQQPAQRKPLSNFAKAAIYAKHFGNPVPDAWYAAINDLEAAHGIKEHT